MYCIGNMTRPLRIEFKGAIYHITSRGNTQQAIFLDEKDFNDSTKDTRELGIFYRADTKRFWWTKITIVNGK